METKTNKIVTRTNKNRRVYIYSTKGNQGDTEQLRTRRNKDRGQLTIIQHTQGMMQTRGKVTK